MGRANRKSGQQVLAAASRAIWNDREIDFRRRPTTPADGGPKRVFFLRQWEDASLQESYADLPQGPPLLEDGEENPEALEITKMALGQIGEDTRGKKYQLIAWEGEALRAPGGRVIPERLILLSDGVLFTIDGQRGLTLVRDSVGYKGPSKEALREGGLGWREGLWRVRQHDFWDVQVKDGETLYTQIGRFVLKESPASFLAPNSLEEVKEFADEDAASAFVENLAETLEAEPLVRDWIKQMEKNALPLPEDRTDYLRTLARFVLTGNGGSLNKKTLINELTKEVQKNSAQAAEIASLIEKIESLPEDLPEVGTPQFRWSIIPIWREISLLRVPDN